jgi:hypothetical protein
MKSLPASLFEREVNKFPPFIERGARGDFTEEVLSILFPEIRNADLRNVVLSHGDGVNRLDKEPS